MADSTGQKPTVTEGLLDNSVSAAAWFAVLDAAKDSTLPGQASAAGARTESLYAGEIGAGYAHVAPHLVALDPKGEFGARLFSQWGRSLGILLQSSASFDEVRTHLRKYLLVKDEGGARCRFRFYDPRVLRAFLPVCTSEEATQFFGPVARFFGEGRLGRTLLVFSCGPRGVTVKSVVVRRTPTPDNENTGAKPPPTGTLSATCTDAKTGEPIVGASVQVTGPDVQRAVTGTGGKARFERLAAGEYEIYAIDPEHRVARAKASVGEGLTRVSLPARTTGGQDG